MFLVVVLLVGAFLLAIFCEYLYEYCGFGRWTQELALSILIVEFMFIMAAMS